MLQNYFRIAWRNLWKNRIFTTLNLGGLAISLAVCLVIFFWVRDELNYDSAALNGDRVFRVALTLKEKGMADKAFALTAAPLAPTLLKDFPEIEKAVRIGFNTVLIGYKDNHFYSNKFAYADPSFFDVFGFPMIRGDAHTALDGSHSVVITESMAKKCFGNEDPMGKTITCDDTVLMKVTGIVKDIPENSHFHFDIIASFKYLELNRANNGLDNWWNDSFYTYLLLKDAKHAVALENKVAHIMDKYNAKENKQMGIDGIHFLQPLKSIHLHSNLRNEVNSNGNITSLRIFVAIAIFLLLIACINYINLTTATSFRRAKEIGMRKVVGAELSQLIAQFLAESILISILGLTIAIVLAVLCMPLFNKLAQTQISLPAQLSFGLIVLVIAFAIVLGILSGLYPALYLSRIKPAKVFKNIEEKKGSLLSLRKVLVIFQFTLSMIMIAATIIALQQLHYMQSRDLGMNKDQVIAVPLQNYSESLLKESIKKQFENKPGIEAVTTSSSTPGKSLNNIVVLPEGVAANATQSMSTLVVDYDFINTYQLKMVAGRAFSADFGGDSSAFILNETAVKDLGWTAQTAIGKGFDWGLGKKGKIIGVVKDFHFNSLQAKITPVVMHLMPAASGWYGYISVKAHSENIKTALKSLEASWKATMNNHPFEYFFVDEDYNKQYQSEQRLSNLSVIFSILTIFISCLGLLGLVLIAVAQRTKEIGIRKVLGASVTGITALISKDFLQLVGIAILIATPISWWLMSQWLTAFPYRIEISWWVFAVTGFVAVLIALLTISFRAISAALANPVNSLRTE